MEKKLAHIIEHFGTENQIKKAMEELWELSKELDEYLETGDDELDFILREIADVEIMLQQLKMIFKIKKNDLKLVKNFKIERTLDRIKEGYYEQEEEKKKEDQE